MPCHVPGGIERHVEDLALGLSDAGCRVHLLSAPLTDSDRQRLEEAGLTTHPVPFANPRRYTLRYLARIGSRIDDLLARHRFDLIHAQEFALGFWRPGPQSPPLAITVHGTITSETPLHPDVYRGLHARERLWAWMRFGRRYLYAPLWRRTLRRARRILVDSAFTRDELAREIPDCLDRVQQVPLGNREPSPEPPDRTQARSELGWDGPHLLTIGRLEWQKGHALALHALARLREMDWHYTIAGVGPYEQPIAHLIQKLGLSERVTLTGYLSDETKANMLRGADLFVWPELTHPAFGLAGLEANLASTPVLATRRGAIPETLGERGNWVVDDVAPEPFAEALRRLLTDPPALLAARADLRRRTLDRFDFRNMIQSTLDAYRHAIDSP